MPTPSKLRRWSMAEWAVCLDAALLLPVTACALAFGEVQQTCAVVARWPMSSARCGGQMLAPPRVVHLVAVVASVYGTQCLSSAIVAHAVLRRLGVASELVIGATGFGSQFRAHAWVERDGMVIPGQSASGYQPLHRFARAATEGSPR